MTAYVRRTAIGDASSGSVDRAMRTLGLSGVRRDKGIRTTIPAKDGIRAGDLLDRDFTATAPNRTWVTDFTYVRTWAGFTYVAFIVDVYAQRIVAWHAATTKQTDLVMIPLRMALWQRGREGHPTVAGQLIHHSDAGSQGGFNWSSQHLDHGGVRWDDGRKQMPEAPAGARRQWAADRALRPPMRSPGRPEPSRAVQREFWRLIATGVTTVEAAEAVGVSWPVGGRWFRHAGGMPPMSLAEPTGRYLSFAEREEIAMLRAQDKGVREIARTDRARCPGPSLASFAATRRPGAASRGTAPWWRSGRRSRRRSARRQRSWWRNDAVA